ncbi:MAG TPA: D-aminoacyl-tRNA deacylase [Thermoplasmata archaeon]|nr:D-aminoacyl-tRNA deacylase [Thermoplasmata archaeon]
MPPPRYVVVLSDPDPVAQAVGVDLGAGESLGIHIDGVPVRALGEDAAVLRRAPRHIQDERLDARLPEDWRGGRTTLVFPSVHRSEQGQDALTVHPLGNPADDAHVGGRARTLVPTSPRLMTDALRRLAEGSPAVGWPATFEATHHGPELGVPAFFIEVGGNDPLHPPSTATKLIASVVRELREDARDRVVLGVGGGHYAPHFTEVALRRSLAFGHILARHVLEGLVVEVARQAWERTPEAAGVVYAKVADAGRAVASAWGPRFRESEAARRDGAAIPRSRDDASPPGAGT